MFLFILFFILVIMVIVSFAEVITLTKYYNYLHQEFTDICIYVNDLSKEIRELKEN